MTIAERKKKLIDKIKSSDQKEFERMEALLDDDRELGASIDRAKNQVAIGQTIPHGEVRKKYEKWLSK